MSRRRISIRYFRRCGRPSGAADDARSLVFLKGAAIASEFNFVAGQLRTILTKFEAPAIDSMNLANCRESAQTDNLLSDRRSLPGRGCRSSLPGGVRNRQCEVPIAGKSGASE